MDMLSLEDFVDDKPRSDDIPFLDDIVSNDLIEGVRLQRLSTRADKRGDLTVLLSALKEPIALPPHVYLVSAEPGSIWAWVYHKWQSDISKGQCS